MTAPLLSWQLRLKAVLGRKSSYTWARARGVSIINASIVEAGGKPTEELKAAIIADEPCPAPLLLPIEVELPPLPDQKVKKNHAVCTTCRRYLYRKAQGGTPGRGTRYVNRRGTAWDWFTCPVCVRHSRYAELLRKHGWTVTKAKTDPLTEPNRP